MKCEWRKFLQKCENESLLQLRTKKQLLTHHLNYNKTEYAIRLIPVKSYKKGVVFLVAKTVKDITDYLISKASKGVFTTVNPSIYSNASQYFGAIKACKKLANLINK